MLLQQGVEALETGTTASKTRHRLIVAAALLFQRRGYHGVGTNDILKLAEAPRGSLYHHFPGGKSDLACAAVKWVTSEATYHIRHSRLLGHEPEKIIEATALGIAAWMKSTDYAEGSLLAAIASCLDETNGDLQAAVGNAYEDLLHEFDLMLRVHGLGRTRAASMAEQVITEIEGATLLARARKNTQPLKDASIRLVNLMTDAGAAKTDSASNKKDSD
jgi:TetR/AcrR family transcriptional repressor of lmrAB and yxaGH operons